VCDQGRLLTQTQKESGVKHSSACSILLAAAVIAPQVLDPSACQGAGLEAGFAEADITPKIGDAPVYMAGFGQDRKATGIHDPLKARAVVLKDGERKLALVSIDVVGYSFDHVQAARQQLPGFTYVLVSSTHNHEGPDTIGLWGPSPFQSGVDAAYMKFLREQLVKSVHEAEAGCKPVSVRLGSARAPELLHDGREPYIKHDDLVAVQFLDKTGKPTGIVVQWNCHPETLGGKNTQLSADFVGATVNHLSAKYGCPVAYFTGTVGGLMTSLHVEVKDPNGRPLADGTVEKTERYGRLIGELAERALTDSKPIRLTPLAAHRLDVFVPLDNKLYLMGRQLGVLTRAPFVWAGDPYKAAPANDKTESKRLCIRTEVGWLQLGELSVALIPGEIYPELVLDKVQDPPDAGADFPDAAIEPAIYKRMPGPHRMLIGLANDEIGYIIPKRQWDEKPPFCYGRKQAQYGEVNSVGPDAAPVLCEAFRKLAEAKE
jgi:hypothetical protein